MQRRFFSGNSLEQAVMSAARHFEIEPERLAYTNRDKKRGFVNRRRRVVIEVDPDRPELTDEELEARRAESSEPSPTATPSVIDVPDEVTPDEREELAGPADEDDWEDDEEEEYEEEEYEDEEDDDNEEDYDQSVEEEEDYDESEDEYEDDEEKDENEEERRPRGGRRGGGGRRGADRGFDDRGLDIANFSGVAMDWKNQVDLEGVSEELAAFEFAVERCLDVMDLAIEYAITEGDTFRIDFSGEDADLLKQEDGRALKAFEHVLPRVVRGLVGETLNCKVDCEGFRAEHEDELIDAARDAAGEVRETGHSKMLPPMNPSDRRIVHLSLADDPDVETVSQGRGYMKRVRIQTLD